MVQIISNPNMETEIIDQNSFQYKFDTLFPKFIHKLCHSLASSWAKGICIIKVIYSGIIDHFNVCERIWGLFFYVGTGSKLQIFCQCSKLCFLKGVFRSSIYHRLSRIQALSDTTATIFSSSVKIG